MGVELRRQVGMALADSEAGKSLSKTYRWGEFRRDETDEQWMHIFGSTGRVDRHMELFYKYARLFVRFEKSRFSPEKESLFLGGIDKHDIGEAKINGKGLGDISAQVKTSEDERKESVMARTVLTTLDLSKEAKDKFWYGYDQVINGKDPDLDYMFKAIETTEYVVTAMNVYKNCKRLKEQAKPGLELEQALVGRVLTLNLAKVLDVYAPDFPDSIGLFFKTYAPLIDDMFTYSLPWLEANDRWMGEPIKRKNKLGKVEIITHKILAEEFKVKWKTFKNQS